MMNTADSISTEEDHLLNETSIESKEECSCTGVLKVFDNIIDWAPLITVQILSGSCAPIFSLGCGTAAAAFVLLYAFLKCQYSKQQSKKIQPIFPKTLDIGQFMLFGFLWVMVLLLRENNYMGNFLVLWFNPFTTGGIAFIMWISIIRGRPFVMEFVQSQMPTAVWTKLSSKKWFMDILTEAAWFWVQILLWMALIVAVQPFVVTVFYGGKVNENMRNLNKALTGVQFVILFYGIYTSAKDSMQRETNQKKIKETKERGGLDQKLSKLHGPPVRLTIPITGANISSISSTIVDHHYQHCHRFHDIQSLTSEAELNDAGKILEDAFQDEVATNEFIKTREGKQSFFTATVKSISYFNLVLGCFEAQEEGAIGSHDESAEVAARCRCVMACIPVLSTSQEEIKVYDSYEAWLEHGFRIPGASETDFPLPNDDLVGLGQMRNKRKHNLTNRPYIYIAFFGAGSTYRGQGYGRTLLQYIIKVSETKKLPLVLETTSAFNISQYERYGFKVVDKVEGRSEWVLMVREI